MGLCKCRVVTNLFCFDHRLNVCENCIVQDHTRCTIKSYLQWLQDQDSPAKPSCGLCAQSLQEGEIVRLTCYDAFHWDCLDKECRALPPTTAPAGYTCPTCSAPIIPTKNSNSPVAAALNQKLSTAVWGKTSAYVPGMDMRASAHDNNAHQMGHANTSPPARDYGNQYKPPPSQYTQQQSTVQISRDDSVDRRPSGLQTASWVTRWKRKLGIRPLALMGRDFTRLAIVCLGVLCLYLLMQR